LRGTVKVASEELRMASLWPEAPPLFNDPAVVNTELRFRDDSLEVSGSLISRAINITVEKICFQYSGGDTVLGQPSATIEDIIAIEPSAIRGSVRVASEELRLAPIWPDLPPLLNEPAAFNAELLFQNGSLLVNGSVSMGSMQLHADNLAYQYSGSDTNHGQPATTVKDIIDIDPSDIRGSLHIQSEALAIEQLWTAPPVGLDGVAADIDAQFTFAADSIGLTGSLGLAGKGHSKFNLRYRYPGHGSGAPMQPNALEPLIAHYKPDLPPFVTAVLPYFRGSFQIQSDNLDLTALNIPADIIDSRNLILTPNCRVTLNADSISLEGTCNSPQLGDISLMLATARFPAAKQAPEVTILGNITVNSNGTQLRRFSILRSGLEESDFHGNISARIDLAGHPENFSYQAKGNFNNCSLQVSGISQRLEGITGPFRFNHSSLLLEPATMIINGIPWRITGELQHSGALDYSLACDTIALDTLLSIPVTPLLPENMRLSGPASAVLRITGNSSTPQTTGIIALYGAQLTRTNPDAMVKDIHGEVLLLPGGLDCAIRFGQVQLPQSSTATEQPVSAVRNVVRHTLRLTRISSLANGIRSFFELRNPDLLYNYDEGVLDLNQRPGLVTVNNLFLKNSSLTFSANGTIIPEPEALELDCRLWAQNRAFFGNVGQEAIRAVAAAVHSDTVTVIPFKLTGTFAEPNYRLITSPTALAGTIIQTPFRLVRGTVSTTTNIVLKPIDLFQRLLQRREPAVATTD